MSSWDITSGGNMIRLSALIAAAAVACLLTACDVQTSSAATGNKTQTSKTRAGADTISKMARARDRAVKTKALSEVRIVRSMCEFYFVEYGRYPSFETLGWTTLLNDGYLDHEPRNPLSPSSVASRIKVVDDPMISGADVDPSEAGWVFNGTRMYAAGLDR